MKTESELLISAIRNLKPTAEFVITDNNYSTIQWHILDGTAPTRVEIDAEIEQIRNKEAEALAAKAAQRQAILDRLGLTADEAALLLGAN